LTEEVPALDVALGLPEAERVPEPDALAESAAAAEPAPATAREIEPVAALAPDEAADDELDADDESAVDALFARIREARSDAEARAHEVFGGEPASAVVVADPAAEPEAEAEPEPDVFDRRDAAIAADEAKLARLFKRTVTDEQNELQDTIRRRKHKVTLDDVLADADTQTTKYEETLGDTVAVIARAGAAMFELTGTIDAESLRPMARRIISASLIAPLRAQLERGFADTATDDERIDRVRSAYREAKTQRADLVAHELANAAFNAGVIAAAPAGTSVRWMMDTARGCSPDCQDNSLAGPIPAGESFPTGSSHPPAHQRCRCLVVPERQ
jgi:hypothetical protein